MFLSKVANFFSIMPLITFIICVFALGTNSFPKTMVENQALSVQWVCWPMLISVALGFVLKYKADPEGKDAGWQVVSIMPAFGFGFALFSMFA